MASEPEVDAQARCSHVSRIAIMNTSDRLQANAAGLTDRVEVEM